jgi:hypothetical protein
MSPLAVGVSAASAEDRSEFTATPRLVDEDLEPESHGIDALEA